jgi:beta-galactosidase
MIAILFAFGCENVCAQQQTFELGDSVFLLNGKPFQMISGEMHYPRIPKEAWRQRMKMAKAMGLNTIGTYVFWNVHEPQKDVYDFSGNRDIAAFIKTAQEEGLWVVLRPSPYVCAEWEFGGYPYWLQHEKGLIVRSREPKYTNAYTNYIKALAKQLAPLQINHGGNILMIQIENEYGSYGNDKEYLAMNEKIYREAGFDGLLFTCDGDVQMKDGHLDGLLPAINGTDNPVEVKKIIRENFNGKGPFYIAEWYPAWFDWWGTAHHTVPAKQYVNKLDAVLDAGISINMYMFHGGTTRGFMNGANYNDKNPFEPQISSYDYDAPLDEAGNATDKFMQFRKVIQKHLPAGTVLPTVPEKKKTMSIDDIQFTQTYSLFNILPPSINHKTPLTFDDVKQDYGYVLYHAILPAHAQGILKINGLRDYAVVMLNKKTIGTLDRRLKQDSLEIPASEKAEELDILVENLGRINYGKYLLQNKKGITENVQLNGKEIFNWKMFQLPFNDMQQTLQNKQQGFIANIPVVKKGKFTINEAADTYLDMSRWGKGFVLVNGHHLGRYWNIGPQQTIYLPVEWLKKGENEIEVFEMLKPEQTELKGIETPILNVLQNG